MRIFMLILMVISVLAVGCSEPAVQDVDDFESCIAAGNPAMESYPRQCRHGDRTYTEVIDTPPEPPETEMVGLKQTCRQAENVRFATSLEQQLAERLIDIPPLLPNLLENQECAAII